MSFLGNRGAIAIVVALTAPLLALTLALGIEVSGWAAMQQKLQRIADMAALAAVQTYSGGSTAQVAATEAAYVAEINGGLGATAPTSLSCTPGTARTWCASTNTLSDNMITVAMVSGVKVSTDTAFKVTINTTVPLFFSRIALTGTGKSISSAAIAEIIPAPTGGQPCLLTLGGDATGVVTSTDTTLNGNANVAANNCTVRSDGGISLVGNAQISALAFYASGTISTNSNTTVSGTQYINQAQIPDPYATYSPIQTALTNAVCSGGTTIKTSINQTIPPGCYASIEADSGAQITMSPGMYYVNGSISLSGSSGLSGSGVAIASTGTFSQAGTSIVSITAPTSGPGAGVVYASTSSSASSLSGSSGTGLTGLVYYPNGSLTFAGNATDGSTGCLEVVASTVTLSGNANLATNCSLYGLPTYGSLQAPGSLLLVQ